VDSRRGVRGHNRRALHRRRADFQEKAAADVIG